jgi:hypothetical protein
MHREMLAGIGFVSDKAILYKTGDRVQQKAAAKAASSPITLPHSFCALSERLQLLLIPRQKLIV